MARRKATASSTPRVSKRALVVTTGNKIKDLIPRDSDFQYYGPEPDFSVTQPESDNRQLVMTKAYNWYSHFYTVKEAKDFLIRYLEDNKANKETVKYVRKAPDSSMSPSAGWTARCATRGLILDQSQLEHIQKTVDKLVAIAKPITTAEDAPAKPVNRVNIQEIMREKANDAGAEIEEMFDNFILDGCKNIAIEKKVLAEFSSRNVLPQHVAFYIKRWETIRNECNEVLQGKCPQLKEAYASYSKTQLKNKVKFCEIVLAELNGYVSLKQTTKKVRARKPVPVEKIVSKLKYCKNFKDEAQKLDLVSIHPSKLHNSTEAWVYDTRKRKMHHYVADNYSKVLLVKGNTLLGFDKKESGMKTLRKPTEQIKALTGSKPAARKYFKDIKAVEAIPNGRFNADMVILKAF